MARENSYKTVNISSLETLNDFLSERDNSENVFYISDIPDVCKEYPCVLGIDEAGRGPVLGPMVYGTAFCPINEAGLLVELQCADSKALTEEKRDAIFSKICESSKKIGWAVEVISPISICNSMLSRTKYSLNQVSMDSAIGLIQAAIATGVNVEHIYVDTVGKPETYQAYLKTKFPKYKITVAKKADSTYPIVSAASICAKVTRDHALQVWDFQEGLEVTHMEFGSGYPGGKRRPFFGKIRCYEVQNKWLMVSTIFVVNNPVTKKFLVDYCDPVFGFPQLVRFSWSTSSNALEETAYHVAWDDVDEENTKPPPNNTSITSFFKMTSTKPVLKTQHEFFKQRCLSRKVEF